MDRRCGALGRGASSAGVQRAFSSSSRCCCFCWLLMEPPFSATLHAPCARVCPWRSNMAMQRVIVDERDLILARWAGVGRGAPLVPLQAWHAACGLRWKARLLTRALPAVAGGSGRRGRRRARSRWWASWARGTSRCVGGLGCSRRVTECSQNTPAFSLAAHAAAPPPSLPCTPLHAPYLHSPAHPQGITKYWPEAGDPALADKAQAYLRSPADEEEHPYLGLGLSALAFGTIAYRRPRVAAFFAGAVALMSAPCEGAPTLAPCCSAGLRRLPGAGPWGPRGLRCRTPTHSARPPAADLGFMVVTVNRFGKASLKRA